MFDIDKTDILLRITSHPRIKYSEMLLTAKIKLVTKKLFSLYDLVVSCR